MQRRRERPLLVGDGIFAPSRSLRGSRVGASGSDARGIVQSDCSLN